VDFAEDVIRFLRSRVAEPAILLGHSLGAQAAMQVASEAPDLTRAIVLEDPALSLLTVDRLQAHPSFYPRLFSWQELAGTELWTNEKMAALAAVYPRMDAAGLQLRAKAFSHLDPDVITHIINSKFNEHFDPEALCPKITCPVLLLQGNPSLGGQLEDSDAERAIALLTKCVHVHVQDMAHNLHSERSALFCQIISNFLESLD
jgi:pimeloyl-ACP methyl ester carboxylesterase